MLVQPVSRLLNPNFIPLAKIQAVDPADEGLNLEMPAPSDAKKFRPGLNAQLNDEGEGLPQEEDMPEGHDMDEEPPQGGPFTDSDDDL
jgi:hypothetical protein